MAKCVEYLAEMYRGIHVGRADPDLLSSVKVPIGGDYHCLPQLCLVSAVNTQLLKVQPYDRSWVLPLERAINDAKLGVTTNRTPDTILVKLPSLSGDRRQELSKLAKDLAEKQRVAIRNLRRDARKISDDHSSIEKITKEALTAIDSMLKAKQGELLPKSLF